MEEQDCTHHVCACIYVQYDCVPAYCPFFENRFVAFKQDLQKLCFCPQLVM